MGVAVGSGGVAVGSDGCCCRKRWCCCRKRWVWEEQAGCSQLDLPAHVVCPTRGRASGTILREANKQRGRKHKPCLLPCQSVNNRCLFSRHLPAARPNQPFTLPNPAAVVGTESFRFPPKMSPLTKRKRSLPQPLTWGKITSTVDKN